MTVPALVYSVKADDKSRRTFESNRREIQKTRRATQGLAADFRSTGKALGSLKAFGAGLGIGVLSADLIRLPSLIGDVVSEASTMAKTADLIGITTTELQQLTFGFEIAGVEASKTEDALKQFGKRLSEAGSKGGLLADILEANGVALRDNQGRMRPVMDLLRDYANLIKGAASSQDKLSLANEAFGRSGAALVLALRNGSLGLTKLQLETEMAGGVLEDEVLRRAEEIDDKFARLWRTFAINGKSAILSVATAMDDFVSGPAVELNLKDIQADLTRQRATLIREIGFAERSGTAQEIDGMQQKLDGLDARIRGVQQERAFRFSGGRGSRSRGGRRREIAPTKIPQRPETGTQSGRKLREQISQYDRLLDGLKQERELIGLSAVEQRKMNALRLAGVDATSEQGQAITSLIAQIQQQNEAQRQANEITSLFGGIAQNQIGTFISQLGLADTAAGRLVGTLIEAALQASLLGQGPLASAFGGGLFPKLVSGFSGGFGGGPSIAGAFAGMYADGGTLGAGRWGIAGENGPEPVLGPAKVVSNKDAFGRGGEAVQVSMIVQSPDAESFMRSETQIAGRLVDAIQRGQRGR
ncbi:MAG: hypothetical protein ABJJ37_27050 [Roseibium sp.]